MAVNGIVGTEDVAETQDEEEPASPKTKVENWDANEEIEAEEGF